nr:hypothetical protein [Tanacetum cinerariifolium]
MGSGAVTVGGKVGFGATVPYLNGGGDE